MVNFIIRIVRLFKGLFTMMGVDYHQLECILRVKLTMDNRRGFSTSTKKKDSSNQLILQSVVYAVIGIFIGTLINSVGDVLTAYTMVFSIVMVMIAMLMISEFSVILIDTRDNAILLPRPINSRTMTLAKILHIAIYLLHLSLSLSIASVVFTVINYGFVAGLFFLLMIFLATLFTLFLTNLFYLGLMRFVNGEKLKDIMVYFQIAMAIIFMGAYQLLPRLIEMNDLYNSQMKVEWFTYLIPSVWFSGSITALISSVYSLENITFLFLALLLPLGSLWLIIKYLSPKFSLRLSQMDVNVSKPAKRKEEKANRFSYSNKVAQLLTQSTIECTSFKMVWKMSGRERKFKQTAFPAFGYIFVLIVVTLFQVGGDEDQFANLFASKRYLLFVYFSMFAAFAVCMNIIYSDEPKSSWFFTSMPISKPGDILSGTIKAVFAKYVLPLYTVIAGLILYFWSYKTLPDLIYAFASIMVITSLVTVMQSKALPFSKERSSQDSGNNFMKGLLMMLSAGLLGLTHWGLTYIQYGVIAGLPIMLVLQYLSFRYIKHIKWNQIED
ncbi:hypothetical protein [Ancylomarina sp. 16SWW S1-10-2]|uniref:hypothetical protein n=1 Tax=Ancylomarina sp. 16SWW S1-10-2 TaxID=2499681 RepID=UPI001DDBAA33|nr:hypothetical protein [Ancylomarina sp. 16SWW S1-10-2]MRT94417.1 hypothetical protein [Ancylomarina sp. 16SWW S1-10-2]